MGFSTEAGRWREACRKAVVRQQELLRQLPSSSRPAGDVVGASGDITSELDRQFESIALDEVGSVRDASDSLPTIVSEEVGEIGPAGDRSSTRVILDPIDGSTNVANGLPQFSLSVAVASGSTMADVWFGFVFDFGTSEELVCESTDSGYWVEVDGVSRREWVPGDACLVGCESAEPPLLAVGLSNLPSRVKEIRVLGSIAIALCYVGLGRLDGLMTCRQCRSVDAAAGQLMAAALGASILFDGRPPSEAGLSLDERYRVVAGRGDLVNDLLLAQEQIPLVPR